LLIPPNKRNNTVKDFNALKYLPALVFELPEEGGYDADQGDISMHKF
jgi:hypothetical protein